MGMFDIVPPDPNKGVTFAPPPDATDAQPAPKHYSILSRLLGDAQRDRDYSKHALVNFYSENIHSAYNDINNRTPPDVLRTWGKELGKELGNPDAAKAITADVERHIASRESQNKLKYVNQVQNQSQQGMGTPAMPGQASAQAAPQPQTPPQAPQGPQASLQRPPGLPAPPAAFPFPEGDQAGAPAPLANVPAPVRAASAAGGTGFGGPSTVPARSSYPGLAGSIVSRADMGTELGQQAMNEKYPLLEKQAELAQRMQAAIVEEAKSIGLKDPAMIADYVNKHPVSQMMGAKPGEVLYGRDGRVLGTGGPQITNMPEGSSAMVTPTVGLPAAPGLPPMPGTAPQSTIVQGPPPKLTPDETLLLSAAQRTAAAHGVSFDPKKDPRNPFAQLPLALHQEAANLHARDKADPDIRQLRLEMGASLEALRQVEMANAKASRSDRSYTTSQQELNAISKPISDRAERISRLQDTLSQGTPAADAFVAPEMVSIMAGGAGSGFRINQSELNAVAGGRTAAENLKSRIEYITNNPNKGYQFTAIQRKQMSDLIKLVTSKVIAKREAVTQAYRDVAGSENVLDHRNVLNGLREKLAAIDEGGLPAPPAGGSPGNADSYLKSIGHK